MTNITFDSLFAIMLAEFPVITNATCFDDDVAWAAQYFDPDNEWCVFLQPFSHSVMVAADREGLNKVEFYHITEVNREYIRERFEEELRYGMTHPDIGYTARDIELVNEYLRTGSASPSHDAAHKKRARAEGPSAETIAAMEAEQLALQARGYVPDKVRSGNELADLLLHLSITPSQAETEFTAIVDTPAVEHKENGSVWERDHTAQSGYIWKAWLEREDWEKHRDPWGVTADGEIDEFEGIGGLEEIEGLGETEEHKVGD